MGQVIIVKTSQNMNQCIGLLNVGKKFISDTFTLTCTFCQTRYV